jgi:hypothetical protein
VAGNELLERTHRVLTRPVDVWVRCEHRFVPRAADFRGVELRVRAYGIDVGAVVPGRLLGWYRLCNGGAWWGLVEYAVGSRNGLLPPLELRELVPAEALSPHPVDGWPRR